MADISTGRQRGIVPFVDETTGRLPDSYLPQGVIDLQGDLEQAVSDASQSATAAQQSASQAQSSATAANSSAQAAAASAESAQTATESAASSKDAAAQSASEASASASAAEASKTNAAASAAAAEASKTNAASSASAAKASETNASDSATAAQQAVDGFGLEVGTTTTGDPGTDAAVEIKKTGTKYTANFTIPRGDSYDASVKTLSDAFIEISDKWVNINTLDNYKEIEGCRISFSNNTTALLVSEAGVTKVFGIPVTPGQKLNVSLYCFLNNFPAYVWATSTDTPNVGSSFNVLSNEDYDYYLGVKSTGWQYVNNIDLIVPDGAKMIWGYSRGDDAQIKTIQGKDYSIKVPENFERKKIFEIEKPIVTNGELKSQKFYSRFNRSAWKWDFNTVNSTVTFDNVNVNATNDDVVGLWMYVNETMMAFRNNTNAAFQMFVDGINVTPSGVQVAFTLLAGWNYIKIPITDNKNHTVSIVFNKVDGDYTVAFDTFEVNFTPKVKPQIMLSFDQSQNIMHDNRWELVNKYGFTATFTNPSTSCGSLEEVRDAFAKGWDWGVYSATAANPETKPDYDNGSVEDWEKYISAAIELCEKNGFFEPISYFSPDQRDSVPIEKALRNLDFKLARCGGSATDNLVWFDDRNMLYIQCTGVTGDITAETVLSKIDEAIANNSSIVVFTHLVKDVADDPNSTTKEVYEAVLSGIRERVDAGLCEVCTFSDFLCKWCPETYAIKMNKRRIKEHNWILSKISQ